MTVVTVGIPSYGRAEKLRACLAGLARQTARARVIVGLDGGSEAEAASVREAARRFGLDAEVFAAPRSGYIPVRAELLRRAGSGVFLSLNDDVLPAADLVERHLEAQGRAVGGVVAAGAAPWVEPEAATALDALVMRTGAVFGDPEQTTALGPEGYRRCFGLNLSFPVEAALRAGGFHELPMTYGYDDLEMAWRLERRGGLSLVAAAGAVVRHDHRMSARDLMVREHRLGRAAAAYARAAPEFSRELFRGDVLEPERLARWARGLEEDVVDAGRSARAVRALEDVPASAAEGTLGALRAAWLPAKRWLWRRGLVEAAAGREADEAGAVELLIGAGGVVRVPAGARGAPIETA